MEQTPPPRAADHPLEQTPPEQTPRLEQTPPGADHPRADTPPSRHPPEQTPPVQCMLGDTGNKRAIRILLECVLVVNMFECARIDRGGKMSSTLNKH